MAADDNVVRTNADIERHFGDKDAPIEESEKFNSTDTPNKGEMNRNNKNSTFGKLYSEESKDIPFEGSEAPGVKSEEESKKYAERLEKAKERLNSKETETTIKLVNNSEFVKQVLTVISFSLNPVCTSTLFNQKVVEFTLKNWCLRKNDPDYYDSIIKSFNNIYTAIVKAEERSIAQGRALRQNMLEKMRSDNKNRVVKESTSVEFKLVINPHTLFKTAILGLGVLAAYKLGKNRR